MTKVVDGWGAGGWDKVPDGWGARGWAVTEAKLSIGSCSGYNVAAAKPQTVAAHSELLTVSSSLPINQMFCRNNFAYRSSQVKTRGGAR